VSVIDPETNQVATLFNPRTEDWSNHFEWSEDLIRLEGRFATGKATIAALSLNRPNLIRLREVLKQANAHPPGF
tara:strand:- start:252 stop:473 length:222 start_codon:yes stop_codon:yes gene_type:complete